MVGWLDGLGCSCEGLKDSWLVGWLEWRADSRFAPFSLVGFAAVPLKRRVLWMSTCAVVFNAYLSWAVNDKRRRGKSAEAP